MPVLKLTLAAAVAATMGLTACTNPNGTNNNAGTGVLLGATTGAILGQAIKPTSDGRAIGAIAGAIIGGAIGNNLDNQEAELRQQLGGSGASIIRSGDQLIVILPESITFDFDSSVLKSQFVGSVQDIARSLQRYPNTVVRVVGHTDSIGTAAHNAALSQNRALSVANVLVNSGVRSSRLRIFGAGSTQPVASNSTAAGRQQNRRVEIIITPAG